MRLTSFLRDLLATGEVTVVAHPAPFDAADLHAADALLREAYAHDLPELPAGAPPFELLAAHWAALVLYHTVQLALVRELDEATVHATLPAYGSEPTPAAQLSADLLLRYLPDLLQLARGLAPADVLVSRLQALARQWPLSFVGHEAADPAAEARLLTDACLRQLYLDRLIAARDLARAAQPQLRPLVQQALGAHAATLWPDFADFVLLEASADGDSAARA